MRNLGDYELPPSWQWRTLPELAGEDGVFIDGDWVESKDQDPNGDVRLIQLADIGDGTYRDKSARFLTSEKAKELRCTFLKAGDVLVARMPDPLGRACVFPGDSKQSVTVVDVCIVRSGRNDFDHRWLASFLNAHPVRVAVSGLQAGSTRKRISRGNLATIPLPVPPLSIQYRIVAEIEKQFTRLDAGIAALRNVQAKLKRYRAVVLKAACEGRLVATENALSLKQRKPVESATQLLERVLGERNKTLSGSRKRTGLLKLEGKPPSDPPEGWTLCSIDEIAECLDGMRRPVNKDERAKRPGTVPYYGANGQVGWIDRHLFDETIVLVVEDETFTGRTQAFSYLIEGKSWVNNHAHVLRATAAVTPKYLNYALAYYPFTERTTGSTGRKKLTQRALMTAPFLLPPAAEQVRIVAEVERRLSVVEELEAVVSANLQRSTRLRQSILQKAFTGEL